MSRSAAQGRPPGLLYIASEDWFFKNHFGHLAKAAGQARYDVGIACSVSGENPLAAEGFRVYPQVFERGQRTALHALTALPRLIVSLRRADADIIHIISLQNILFAALPALLFTKADIVLAPTGLGRFWVEQGLAAKAARAAIKFYLRFFRGPRFFYLFENEEDAAELGLKDYPRLRIVGGAGIDEALFVSSPLPPAPPLRAAIVARMLHDKGILESATAVRKARAGGHDIELDLWGTPDPANASSLTEAELQALTQDGVRWRGETRNPRAVWENTHVAMLLSKREGLPKALLEAAACGRPMIVADVPGCRALVRDGQEGFLVDAANTDAVARILIRLAQDGSLREKLGANARARILGGFTQTQVAHDILSFYGAILSGVTPPRARPL